jgi:hypothetical protein
MQRQRGGEGRGGEDGEGSTGERRGAHTRGRDGMDGGQCVRCCRPSEELAGCKAVPRAFAPIVHNTPPAAHSSGDAVKTLPLAV